MTTTGKGARIDKEIELNFPIVRVTLLGGLGVGKTRLIHSLLCNIQESDSCQLDHTERVELYYRILLVEGKPVLLELEDTIGTNLLRPEEDWLNLSDDAKLSAAVCKYFTPTWSPPVVLPQNDARSEGADYEQPFAIFQAPCLTNQPITPHRMVYLVMFDLTDANSCNEALEIHQLLKLHKARVDPAMSLVVFLVGSHSAADPAKDLQQRMEEYATGASLPYFLVDSIRGTGVQKLFKQLCKSVIQTPLVFRGVTKIQAGGGGDDEES